MNGISEWCESSQVVSGIANQNREEILGGEPKNVKKIKKSIQ
jgi:hypothetical protein